MISVGLRGIGSVLAATLTSAYLGWVAAGGAWAWEQAQAVVAVAERQQKELDLLDQDLGLVRSMRGGSLSSLGEPDPIVVSQMAPLPSTVQR
jgi:hypothetical protein